MANLMNPAVIKPQKQDISATPAQATIGELMETLHIVPKISQMP
jgi:hypothetical protein